MARTIYFDNNATTQVAPEVTEAMLPFFTTYWGNPSSMHTFGGQVAKYVDKAREQVAALFNARPSEIIFTSCGTESDNTAIWTALQTNPAKKHIVTTSVEHPAILQTAADDGRVSVGVPFLPVSFFQCFPFVSKIISIFGLEKHNSLTNV